MSRIAIIFHGNTVSRIIQKTAPMFSCEAVHYWKGSILVFLEIFASNDKIFSLGGGGGRGEGVRWRAEYEAIVL